MGNDKNEGRGSDLVDEGVSLRALKLQELTDVQCSDGNWNCDPYMHGMANGMLLALAIMTDTEPNYLEAPNRWLGDKKENSKPEEAKAN